MATIKLQVLKSTQCKDGSFKIRIAIGHKRDVRYITTKYKIRNFSDFSDGMIVHTPNAHGMNIKLRNLLNDYEERLENIPYLDNLTCAELRDRLKGIRPHLGNVTFENVLRDYQAELIEDGRKSYANMLDRALRLMLGFANNDVYLSDIDTYFVSNFDRYLKRKGLSTATIGMTLSMVRTIVNRAIKQQLITYPLHPFAYWKRPASEEREIDITVGDLQKIIAFEPTSKPQRVAKDLFLLSYYLGGINLIDLLAIDFSKCGSILEYTRQKSRNTKQSDKRISFTIQPEAMEIIGRWKDRKTGRLDFGYKFSYRNFLRFATRSIKALAVSLELENAQRVCYYSARKSFVQHGFDLGISLEVLEYCIGQSMKNNRPIFNYLKIMRRHADKAMRLIFDSIKQREGHN